MDITPYIKKKSNGPVLDVMAVVTSALGTLVLGYVSGIVATIREWGAGYVDYLAGWTRGSYHILGLVVSVPRVGISGAWAANARWIESLGVLALPVALLEGLVVVVVLSGSLWFAIRRVWGAL